jgi:ribosomal protein L22
MSLRLLRSVGLINRGLTSTRAFTTTQAALQDKNGSLFGDVTELQAEASKKRDFADSLQSMGNADEKFDISKVTLKNDTKLQDYTGHTPQSAVKKLLTPLKQQIFEASVQKNGFFKNNEPVTLQNGDKYKLKLSAKELEVLEPSMYLKSYRLKSSWKKATIFLRFVSGMNAQEAITQGQFHSKKIGKEVSQLLQDGLKDAEQLGLDPKDLYISQIWCGSDGMWRKRVDPKGRGRTGIIHHPYIHVRAILKTPQTKQRLAWEKEQKELKKKVVTQLPNEKLRFKLDGHYKW